MVPLIQITIDGQDVASRVAGRTVSCTITETDGGRADEMTLVVSNWDGQLRKPQRDAIVEVALGFRETGTGKAGRFVIQEVVKAGPLARFEITGHAPDLNKQWKKQKSRSWQPPKKLGDVLAEIAQDNGCQPAIGAAFMSVPITKVLVQHGESDMHLWTRLARHYGAIGKVSSGQAIFVQAGAGQTASGAAMAPFVVTPNDLEAEWRITDKDRPRRGKVKGKYYDRAKGQHVEVSSAGTSDDTDAPDYTFPQIFGSEVEAQKAVDARKREFSRGEKSFSGVLKTGSTQLRAGGVLQSQGFGDDDDMAWTVKRLVHSASVEGQSGGYVTSFEAETKKDQ